MILLRRFFAATAAATSFAAAAYAECDITYTVESGDTLTSIATSNYGGDETKWPLIYYSNQKILSSSDLQVAVGMQLFIPCSIENLTPDDTPLQDASADMKLLTGGNNAPFTDPNWPGQGIITELINAAMEETPAPVSYSITWEDDWSQHLFPMLDDKEFDMGFPWFRPDCEAEPENEICNNFHFSDPVMNLLVMIYVPKGEAFAFEKDNDILGKSLCHSEENLARDLDRKGREWLKRGLVSLLRANDPEVCFEMLMQGKVDAVAMNAVLGARVIGDMGLSDRVQPLARPLSEQSLHVVISKKHWRGTTHLYRINAGIAALKSSGRYNKIVFRHLNIFENSVKN